MKVKLQILASFLLALLLACALTGCGKPEDTVTLWVVTEQSRSDGMNTQIKQMVKAFRESHPGFGVELEILPPNGPARETAIKKIHMELMAERGPDVFLLPTASTSYTGSQPLDLNRFTDFDPLFADAEQVMRNGMFYNLSRFYDADEALGKERLNKAIMDAGTIHDGGKLDGRYILPLRYNFSCLLVDNDQLKNYDLTLDDLDGSIQDLMNLAIERNSHTLACGLEPSILFYSRGFSFLPPAVDHLEGRVTVTKEEITQLLRSFQQVENLVSCEGSHRFKPTITILGRPGEEYLRIEPNGAQFVMFPSSYDILYPKNVYQMNLRPYKMFPTLLPVRTTTLEDTVVFSALNKVGYGDYAMLPIKTTDGKLNAYVTWYGALGGGTKHPQEAYELLRLFLTEEAQFERERPWAGNLWIRFPYYDSFIAEGWPVRSVDGTDDIWRVLRTSCAAPWKRVMLPLKALNKTHLTDQDLPLLEEKIDHVYFGQVLEQDLAKMFRSLNDHKTGRPAEVDIEKMAEEFIKKLQLQVWEG